ncbi:MAG TPA: hypothetical protein VGX23_33660 [Actinocrinis sp.]|nr:hypothetical protein [Actinocrinis sp.]
MKLVGVLDTEITNLNNHITKLTATAANPAAYGDLAEVATYELPGRRQQLAAAEARRTARLTARFRTTTAA